MEYLSKHFVTDGVDFLVLEQEECTKEQWQALLDIFGLTEAECIKITEYKLEAYGRKKDV